MPNHDSTRERERRLHKCHLNRLLTRCKSKINRDIGFGTIDSRGQTVSRSPISEVRCENSLIENGKLVKVHRAYLNESDYKVGWVLDSQKKDCYLCRTNFSFFRRRHHCRQCGDLVCNACSRNRYVIRGLVEPGGSRTCDGCVTHARQSFNWDFAVDPLERAETIVPGFGDDLLAEEEADLEEEELRRVDAAVRRRKDQAAAAVWKEEEEEAKAKADARAEPEVDVEAEVDERPTYKSSDLIEQRLGLDTALDVMHKFVDRLVLNDTCDTSQGVFHTHTREVSPASMNMSSESVQQRTTPPAMSMVHLMSSSERTDRSIGSKVLQDVMATGVWEAGSTPGSSSSPAFLSSPSSGGTMGTLGSVHISEYGADSGRVARIMDEIDQNGVWEAANTSKSIDSARSEHIKMSPPVRMLGRDFDESPIVYQHDENSYNYRVNQ